jgi:serine protease
MGRRDEMAKCKVVALIGLLALLIGVVWIGPPSTASAAEFHVTNAAELQDALDEAEINGVDDIIYLAAGTYEGNFVYIPPVTEHKSLTITGESGTSAADIILDGQGSGKTLYLYDWSGGPAAEIKVNGITVQNGNSSRYGGGIFAALADYDISITNCIVRDNTAQRFGGGIEMESDRSLTLENNLIMNNTITEDDQGMSRGGGVSMISVGHEYTIRNNIIVGNSAQGTDARGGGLRLGWIGSDIIHLIGNTIADNEAVKGGGVYFRAGNTANVYNNIIYFNSATDGDDIYFDDVTNRIGHNNDYTELHGNWTDSGGNIDLDPLFVDPAAGDYHLQADSPCIDVGTSDVADPPGLPATDFDGNDRVIGSAPDMGAYEFVPPGGLSGVAIAGIVIGVCAAAGLIAYFVIRRRRAAGKRA